VRSIAEGVEVDEQGEEITLTAVEIGKGSYFGERGEFYRRSPFDCKAVLVVAALMYREPRAANVTAVVATSCLVISQVHFNLLLGKGRPVETPVCLHGIRC
jgi:CRP-like cAMP-binding protein